MYSGASSSLMNAFVTPFAASAGQAGNTYAANMLAPPPTQSPPPNPPTLYLPPPGPIYLDTSWRETGHILSTWISVTALALGAGVALGLGTSLCVGKRAKDDAGSSTPSSTHSDHETEEDLSLASDDPEKLLKQTIIRNI